MPNLLRKKLHKALFAVLLGTALEYYDIALFAFIAPILAEVFLQNLEPAHGTMVMFITYGVGIMARPLGSYVFGRLGDKYGRVKPLYITTCSMALLSALISIVPGYETFGIYSLILFTFLRILQQFFISGHFNGGAIYCIEHSDGVYPPGFVSGIYNAATVAGIVFAAFVAMVIAHFGSHFWRLGYLIGACGAIVALLMRKHFVETPVFLKSKLSIFTTKPKTRKTSVKFSISITMVSLLFGMLYTFSAKVLNVIIPEISAFNIGTVLRINLYVIVCYFFLLILFGYTADIIGAKKQMLFAAGISIPLMFCVSNFEYVNIFWIFAAKFIIIAVVAMLFGPAHSYFVSELAIHKRYRVISMLYAIGKVLSGFSPALFLYFWNSFGNINYIAICISVVAIIVITFLMQIDQTSALQ